MNGLERLRALGARLERLAAERVTVKVDGKPLWRELLDIAGQIECEQAEPGGGMRPGLKVFGLDFKELREGEEVWSTKLGKIVTISHVRPNGTVTLYNHGCTPFRSLDFTHEVPPLDADGVEIRAGDEMWDVDGSGPFIVSGFVGEPLAVIFEIAECNDLPRKPSQLTHRAPVLAADGRPLREKNIVFDKDTGEKLGVDAVDAGDATCRRLEHGGAVVHYNPRFLVHERPDSWERWREEWQWPPAKYCKLILGVEYDHYTQIDEAFDAQGEDLERRAKKLAGVE